MKWTVLTDNRTQNPLLETEHGLSIYLETEHHRILLDTGASDMFIRNAKRLGVDLSEVDYVFISHGHSDHAGGLRHFLTINEKARIIVSPEALKGKFYSKRKLLHSITAVWPQLPEERLILVDETCQLEENLHVIAHIPQVHPLPKGNLHLFAKNAEGELVQDDFRHELAFYVDGLLFTGCAHSGLENILDACPWPVDSVVGGFHLLDSHETEEELTALAMKLKTNYPNTQFFTSHCTGDEAFNTLKKAMREQIDKLQIANHKLEQVTNNNSQFTNMISNADCE
ncbi:MAG: MBL fold metallo-hydrolase [Prevotella sp.]|nr:MBL fold metallo-hydrolase [Prevotella sp.]